MAAIENDRMQNVRALQKSSFSHRERAICRMFDRTPRLIKELRKEINHREFSMGWANNLILLDCYSGDRSLGGRSR
ncbi:hypothetical protein TNCV_1192761 [Trichonephila clavipes]|nr:hypothetical protein TNCV_1192761 [Trichonephila clavipes]